MPLVAVLAMSGCPGKTDVAKPDPDRKPARVSIVDQSFVDYPEKELTGAIAEPAALGRPGMIRVTPSRPTTLARQRRKASRSGAKPADVHVLVTMLWDSAANLQEGTEIQRALRKEALDALRDLYARVGDGKASAETLQMLAAATMWAQDWTAAEAAYKELIARFPDHASRGYAETWLAVLYLRRGRFTDAAALTETWKLESIDYTAAYTLAWVELIKGKVDAARDAMLAAAKGWKGAGQRRFAREMLFVLARSNADAEAASRAVEAVAGESNKDRLLDQLATEYQNAGRYRSASAVLSLLSAARGAATARSVDAELRRAELEFLLGKPKSAAKLAIEAHQGLSACADCSDDLRKRVDDRTSQFAVFFHNTYHDCLDESYFDAAKALYEYLMSVPGADADARRGNLANLVDTRDRAKPASGKHNAEVLYKLAVARSDTVRACYEGVLLGNRVLSGSLVLRLEIDSDGSVSGAATEPAAGLEGMSAVGGCVAERARDWKFPSRTVPGTTAMSIPFLLRPAGS